MQLHRLNSCSVSVPLQWSSSASSLCLWPPSPWPRSWPCSTTSWKSGWTPGSSPPSSGGRWPQRLETLERGRRSSTRWPFCPLLPTWVCHAAKYGTLKFWFKCCLVKISNSAHNYAFASPVNNKTVCFLFFFSLLLWHLRRTWFLVWFTSTHTVNRATWRATSTTVCPYTTFHRSRWQTCLRTTGTITPATHAGITGFLFTWLWIGFIFYPFCCFRVALIKTIVWFRFGILVYFKLHRRE